MKKNRLSHCVLTLALLLTSGIPLQAEVDQDLKNTILKTQDETILIQVLNRPNDGSEEDFFLKSIACKQLAQIGTEAALPALEAMLPYEKLNHDARLALETIPSPKADEILLRAAQTLAGQLQADVIDSIGNRKILRAVPLLRELVLTSKEPLVRRSCRETLGKLATDDAIQFLLEQTAVCQHCPCLAQGLLNAAWACESDGRTETALKIYDSLRDVKLSPANARAGRYQGLLLRGKEAIPQVLEGLKSEDPDVFEPSLKVIREFKPAEGPALTTAILAELETFPAEKQVLLLRALSDRPDPESLRAVFPALEKWLTSDDDSRQATALLCFQTAGKTDPTRVLDLILALYQAPEQLNVPTSPRSEFQTKTLRTLAALPGPEVDAKVLELLGNAPADHLQLLASIAEDRELCAAAPRLLQQFRTNQNAQPIRDRIISAAAALISVKDFENFLACLDVLPIENQIQSLLQKACAHLPQEQAAEAVTRIFDARLADLRSTQSTQLTSAVRLLNLQALIGGPTALACLEKACLLPETIDPATRILGKWSDPATIEASADVCLKVAQSVSDEKFRIRALRSYVRVPRQFNLPPEKKIAMCARFFEAATRNEDRLLVFDVLQRTIHAKSADAAFSYANHDFCREAACETVVKIAREFKDRSPETAAVLEKVVAATQNEDLRKAADEQRLRLK